jgi:hypothetical protein
MKTLSQDSHLNSHTWGWVNCVRTEQRRITLAKHLTHTHTHTRSVVRMHGHHPTKIYAGIQVKLHAFPAFTDFHCGRFTPCVHGNWVGRRAYLGAMVETKIPTVVESRSIACFQALDWQSRRIQTLACNFICHYSDIIYWGDAVITNYHLYKTVALHAFSNWYSRINNVNFTVKHNLTTTALKCLSVNIHTAHIHIFTYKGKVR